MLEHEGQVPAKLAYDRPSPKLIGFMGKHYGLKSFVPQNNNYVVFDEYYRQAAGGQAN
jgi:alpha-tubulin N-acetyltransferase 1